MFNISEFKSYIGQTGYAPTNKFFVDIGIPPLMFKSSLNVNGSPVSPASIGKDLQMRAESARAPGILITTNNNQRYGMGPYQQVPNNVNFTNTSMTFLADSRGLVWSFFYQWFNTIFGFDEVISGSRESIDYNTFRVNYKEDYVSDIAIRVFDHAGKQVSAVQLIDAFPISMNDISLAWDSTNQLKRITVSFSYRSWKMLTTTTNADQLATVTTGAARIFIPSKKPNYTTGPGGIRPNVTNGQSRPNIISGNNT